jgi:hypothetical protein
MQVEQRLHSIIAEPRNKFYAGIGSRETPVHIQTFMTEVAQHLKMLGYTCRTGYAIGADRAFYRGATPECIVYNPENIIVPSGGISLECPKFGNWHVALEIAESFHGGWKDLSPFAKLLIARNTYQILGDDLNTPSDFIICWTRDASTGKTSRNTGGTGQAIRIAHHLGIPIYNLADTGCMSYVKSFMKGVVEL